MREAGAGVRETQGAQGQLTASKGPERMGYSRHENEIAFPSKLFPFQQVPNTHPLDFYV
jgi:hypothetical protein